MGDPATPWPPPSCGERGQHSIASAATGAQTITEQRTERRGLFHYHQWPVDGLKFNETIIRTSIRLRLLIHSFRAVLNENPRPHACTAARGAQNPPASVGYSTLGKQRSWARPLRKVGMRVSRGILSLALALAVSPSESASLTAAGHGEEEASTTPRPVPVEFPENAAKAAYKTPACASSRRRRSTNPTPQGFQSQKSAKALDKVISTYSRRGQFIDCSIPTDQDVQAWKYIGFGQPSSG